MSDPTQIQAETKKLRRRQAVRVRAPRMCVLCQDARAHRRGACWACYRKLREANLPLPLPRSETGGDPIDAWTTILSRAQCRRLIGAMRERVRELEREKAVRHAENQGTLFPLDKG